MLCLVTQKDSAKIAQKKSNRQDNCEKNDLQPVKKGNLCGGEDYFL